MTASGRARARGGAGLAAAVLAVCAAAGCGDAGGTSPPTATPGASLDAVRTKLRLVVQDPCYTSPDVRGQWPRCARWEEEVRNIANAAAVARPGDREITDPATAVQAAHERYMRAGCGSGGTPAGPDSCVAALTETRTAVARLAGGLSSVR